MSDDLTAQLTAALGGNTNALASALGGNPALASALASALGGNQPQPTQAAPANAGLAPPAGMAAANTQAPANGISILSCLIPVSFKSPDGYVTAYVQTTGSDPIAAAQALAAAGWKIKAYAPQKKSNNGWG